MLNEKEIEKAFDKYGVVLKHGESYPKVLTWGGFQKAAHAIAEKMREGVAWEKVVQMERDPDNPNDLVGWSDEDDGDYTVYILGDHQGIEEECEYRVTVSSP